MREGTVRIVDDEVVEPDVSSRPPGWLIVAVVVAGIGVASFVVSQASTSSDPTPDAEVPSIDGTPQTGVAAGTPHGLRGHVAVTSPYPRFSQHLMWVFRPGGSLVSRTEYGFRMGPDPYPILMTAGHLMFSGINGWTFGIDLVESPTLFGSNRSVIPGAEPGVVWFARRSNDSGPTGSYLWVAPVAVGSLTVGDRVDITDVFTHPVVGVSDGLIVVPIDQATYGRFAYWSPTGGLAPIGLRDPSREMVVGASGNLVVVALRGGISIFDISSSDYVSSFPFDFGDAVTSACLSPDREHVVVVGSNGEAIVGNTTSGETIGLVAEYDYHEVEGSIQRKHGVGWTANDQVVFILGDEDAKHLFVSDIPSGAGFHMADLDGPEEWWLAASGSMC